MAKTMIDAPSCLPLRSQETSGYIAPYTVPYYTFYFCKKPSDSCTQNVLRLIMTYGVLLWYVLKKNHNTQKRPAANTHPRRNIEGR